MKFQVEIVVDNINDNPSFFPNPVSHFSFSEGNDPLARTGTRVTVLSHISMLSYFIGETMRK